MGDGKIKTFITCIELMLIIAFGQLLKQTKFFKDESIYELNNFVFTFAFPINIILSFYGENIEIAQYIKFTIILVILFTLHLIFSLGSAKLVEKENSKFIATANCLYRGNFIILGFPIINTLIGNKGIALTGIAVIISQIFYNFTTVSLYSTLDGKKRSVGQIFLIILKNPMALAGIMGIVLMLTKINLGLLYNPLKMVGNVGSPLALLCLGYSVELKISKKLFTRSLLISVLKLIVFPIFVILFIKMLKLDYITSVVLVVLFSAPVAVNTFTFARKYDSQLELVGSYVILSTILFTLTIPILIKFLG